MPYIFVGFDICHQSYSPPLPGFAPLVLWGKRI